jgi:hypothetical protein
MSLTTRFGLVAGTTALAMAGTAFGGVESDNDALSQIAELKAELAQLKQQDSQDRLTEQRATEIRGIVQDVLADADTRTSFQSSGAMAGWNNGFFLASPDGNFKLNVQGFMQVRWTMNKANGYSAATPAGAEYEWGFENANTWLDFSGNVVDPSWTFHVRGNFANGNGGAMGLQFASISKDFGNGFSVTAGQFRAPWLRETLVDDQYQLGMDRSLVNEYFTQGYDQGVQVGYASDAFRVNAFAGDGVLQGVNIGGVNAGVGSANTPWNATATNYAFAARGEYKISGDWAQFDDFTSRRGEEGGMMVGVAAVYERGNQNAENPNGANAAARQGFNGTKAYGFTGDFTWDFGGANLFASFVWMGATGGQTSTTHPWGINIQGGYFVTDDIEVFGRYGLMNYDLDNAATDTGKYNGLTAGANYFFADNVKFTVEWGMNLKSFGANGPANINSAGFRTDVNGEKDQWALRAQMQLLF